MTPPKELLVSAIKDGTVIDHIAAGQALAIIRILGLSDYQKVVTVGLCLPSHAMGKKDLLKIEGRELNAAEANEVALFAPQATVNIIRNYKITKKFAVKLPELVESFIVCPNRACITNHESITTVFYIIPGKSARVRCQYCEKIFALEEIKEYNL